MVSGVLALMRQKYPDESSAQIIRRLIDTAEDRGDKGRDPQYGYGMVDPMAALSRDEDVSGTRKNPLGSVESWAKVHRRADPTDEPSEPPAEEHRAGERIAPVAAPQPAPGNHVNLLLPVGLIAAVAGWMWLLASGTVARLRRVLGSPPHPPMRILAESLGWTRRRTKAERGEKKERRSDFWGPRQ